MLQQVRGRLTFANVIAFTALFVALGGSVYAASKIDGGDIKRGSIPGNRLEPNDVGPRQVNERRLTFRCPGGTINHAGGCFETGVRAAQNVFDASTTCAQSGRRLATASELVALADLENVMGLGTYEVSSSIYSPENNAFGYIGVRGDAVVDDFVSSVANVFRCVASPVKFR